MMTTSIKIFAFTLIVCISVLPAQTQRSRTHVGFVDKNKDGINDLFVDADGDGVNDITGKAYPRPFQFEDKNRDGKNDLWIDADGDGVNDLMGKSRNNEWIDLDGDGMMDEGVSLPGNQNAKGHVMDINKDKINDITGEKINGDGAQGYKYGRVNEESGMTDQRFTDLDGDGMNDHFIQEKGQGGQKMDVFIDLDGDGIADQRGLGRLKSNSKGKKGN